jgi:hypothetical protein
VAAAQKEFVDMRAYVAAHNEAQLQEARRRFAEAVAAAQVGAASYQGLRG